MLTFVDLVERYLKQGIAQLHEAGEHLPGLSQRLLAVLAEDADQQTTQVARAAIAQLENQWAQLEELDKAQAEHEHACAQAPDVDARNAAQHQLRARFTPFFSGLHGAVKALDKAIREMDKRKADAARAEGKRVTANRQTRAVKDAVQALHDELKAAECFYQHVSWLQERFPEARYEDVTGLCKLASLEEIKEQDWSLNPGRYVGVVIEEDGKTEEEFISLLDGSREELARLSKDAQLLGQIIDANIMKLLEV